MSNVVDVTCLVLRDRSGHVFATQRPLGKRLGGFWEFPGGKVEVGETPQVALRREIREELNLLVGELSPLHPVEHAYDFGTIRLLPFLSDCSERPIVQLAEHTAACWILPERFETLDWAPADGPILEELRRLAVSYVVPAP